MNWPLTLVQFYLCIFVWMYYYSPHSRSTRISKTLFDAQCQLKTSQFCNALIEISWRRFRLSCQHCFGSALDFFYNSVSCYGCCWVYNCHCLNNSIDVIMCDTINSLVRVGDLTYRNHTVALISLLKLNANYGGVKQWTLPFTPIAKISPSHTSRLACIIPTPQRQCLIQQFLEPHPQEREIHQVRYKLQRKHEGIGGLLPRDKTFAPQSPQTSISSAGFHLLPRSPQVRAGNRP